MPHRSASLPEPTPDERALSAALAARIRAAIEAGGGTLPFARFMELALYAPGLGYYSAGKHKFGAAGDFVTAPELGPVFARCLARQCAQILEATRGDILEAGAGSGALATELLLELERLGQLPQRYFILELGTELRARQAETLRTRAPQLAGRVTWLDALPGHGFRGVIVGNELLDAMPVERFRVHGNRVAQLAVGWHDGQFVWRETEAGAALCQRVAALNLPDEYESEIGLAAEGWVGSVADVLEHGALLLSDYGFPRREFYHPQRAGGTLMCHYRHRAHSDPLILPGLQDITAHVDFSAIAEAGTQSGLDLLGYTSQASFLLGCGLDEVAAQAASHEARAQLMLTSEIKKLTLPHEMGELFKVIALGRGLSGPLRGFRISDRQERLEAVIRS
jgi:SAM-dependent MidA family methyltransferase